MGINKYIPHIHVLPEDKANSEIANGFLLDSRLDIRAIKVLPLAGGWSKVVDQFRDVHVPLMNRYPERRIILLVDLDGRLNRLTEIKNNIPDNLSGRVFILSALSEPERLKSALGMTPERIGKALAEDCVNDARTVWGHELLRHNETELDLMDGSSPTVREILFPRSASVSSFDP